MFKQIKYLRSVKKFTINFNGFCRISRINLIVWYSVHSFANRPHLVALIFSLTICESNPRNGIMSPVKFRYIPITHEKIHRFITKKPNYIYGTRKILITTTMIELPVGSWKLGRIFPWDSIFSLLNCGLPLVGHGSPLTSINLLP